MKRPDVQSGMKPKDMFVEWRETPVQQQEYDDDYDDEEDDLDDDDEYEVFLVACDQWRSFPFTLTPLH